VGCKPTLSKHETCCFTNLVVFDELFVQVVYSFASLRHYILLCNGKEDGLLINYLMHYSNAMICEPPIMLNCFEQD